MKQVLQSLRTGVTEVAEVPCPAVGRTEILVRSSRTLVSAGTERALLAFARAGWIDKARQQPERVRQVVDKVRADGLAPTVEAVLGKLDRPATPGYCNVGTVMTIGAEVSGFAVGDRVTCNGKHAEATSVPMTLCAKVPDSVSDDEAAFTVIGAIALEGIRLAQPTLGEAFVVAGLGLVGLMTVQLLRAHGCRVLAIDFDGNRLALARGFGAETVDLSSGGDPLPAADAFSRGGGVDAVLIAAATDSSDPIRQAAKMCRKRGRIVLVGVTGLALDRTDFYEKELTFQVSCSYGPGRYDPQYEEGGHDYPRGFVRWTAQRNFEAILDMMAAGAIDVAPLISHRFTIDEAPKVYDLLASGEASLGILLQYSTPRADAATRATVALSRPRRAAAGKAVIGLIGAGEYGGRFLARALRQAGADLDTIVSATGVSASHYGRKFGFATAASDVEAVIDNERIDTVCIATRHDSHAALVRAALKAGKHVLVEKPLCLTMAELDDITADLSAMSADGRLPLLAVGFNRRFAPMVARARTLLADVAEPKSFIMTVNAGAVPADHWTQDPEIGGGRIVGEACHFIDLLRYLAGAAIIDVTVTGLRRPMGPPRTDNAIITLTFADGSVGTIHYLANGHRAFAKERLEVFCGGRVLVVDNYRRFSGHGWPQFKRSRAFRQDKGRKGLVDAFVAAVRAGGGEIIPLDQILEVSRVAIAAAEAAG